MTLVEETLDAKFTVDYPARLIGDKAYDSDPLDHWIKLQYHTEVIAPNRSNKKLKTQAEYRLLLGLSTLRTTTMASWLGLGTRR